MRQDAAQGRSRHDMMHKTPTKSRLPARRRWASLRLGLPAAALAALLVLVFWVPDLAHAQDDVDQLRLRVRLPGGTSRELSKDGRTADEILRELAIQLGAELGRPWPEPALRTSTKNSLPELEALTHWRELRLAQTVPPSRVQQLLSERGLEAEVEAVYLHGLQQATTPLLQSPNLQAAEILGVDAAHAIVRSAEGPVVVAVVDGGTDWRHEDLVGVLHRNTDEVEGNGIDDDLNGFVDDLIGWNFPLDSPDPTGLVGTPINAEHGTHIAGIPCADDDNGVGVVGISGGAALMPINAGDALRDRVVAYGYEGILYAALNGAKVINCSWGRRGRWSHFEEQVLQAVEAMGAVVVAAAGNEILGKPFFPAYYPTVLSVTSIRGTLVHNTIGANADYWIDLSAPGVSIRSTMPGNRYDTRRGTSQAAAHVSGVAALVFTQHPEWTPRQLREQLRWSAISLDDYNDTSLFQRMGTGTVSAYRALSETPPGVVIESTGFRDEDNDGVVEAAEVVTGSLRLRTMLRDAPATKLELFTDDPYLLPLLTELRVGGVGMGAPISAPRAFSAWVAPQAPVAHLADLRIQITTAEDTVHTWLGLELNPLHVDLNGEYVEMGVAANGKLGFASILREGDPGGAGLRRPGELPRILGGSFVIGNSENQVSDAHYSLSPDDAYEDFLPQGEQAARLEEDPDADLMAVVEFSDRSAPLPLGIRVRHEARLFNDPRRGSFVISRYRLRTDRVLLSGVRAGFLVDWSPHEGIANSDEVHSDAVLQMGYALDRSGVEGGAAVGLRVLEAPAAYAASWVPDVVQEGGRSPGFYDVVDYDRKLSDPELWAMLTRENDEQPSPHGNLAQMISIGPFELREGEEQEIVVAWLLGEDEAELISQSELARQVQASLRTGFGGELATQLSLLPFTPNPFRSSAGGTMLRFTTPQAGTVRLRIFDVRGRLVRVLLDEKRPAGSHLCPWNGQDASGRSIARGVYHVLLETPTASVHRSVTLLE